MTTIIVTRETADLLPGNVQVWRVRVDNNVVAATVDRPTRAMLRRLVARQRRRKLVLAEGGSR